MAHDFTGYGVIVTGSAGGIGRAAAELFLRSGAAVTLFDRDEIRLAATATELANVGTVAGHIVVDLTDPDAVDVAVQQASSMLPGIDVLVNNAGIECVGGLEELSIATIARAIDVNLLAVLIVTRACLPHLRRSERAAIVSVASQAAKRGTPQVGVYSAGKAGVLGWSRSAAVELAPAVRVNAVCPGIVDTPMIERHYDQVHRIEGIARDKARREFESLIPLGRTQKPADIAKAIAFLASSDASEITGQALNVCGGMVMD